MVGLLTPDTAVDGVGQTRADTRYPSWPTITSPGYDRDANGNTTARPERGSSAAGTFQYDQANRLTGADMQAIVGTTTLAHQATYIYDGDGVRTGKTVDGVSTSYPENVPRGEESAGRWAAEAGVTQAAGARVTA